MTKQQNWFVYLLRCADGTLYCGITTDMARRLAEHNGERAGGAKYTRARRPVTLCAKAACRDRSAASKLEARLRVLPRGRKEEALRNIAEKGLYDCEGVESK